MLSHLGEGLMKVRPGMGKRRGAGAHQVPPLVLDGLKFFLTHDGKDTFWGTGGGMKFEIQREDVGRAITKVVKTEKQLVDDLERVVTRSEGKYCVQGCHDASTGGEVEKVAVAILSEAPVRRLGELGGQDVGVGIVPSGDRMQV